MKFCTLFSGSSGNASFISNGETRILIDAGASGAKIKSELESIGENIEDVDAVFVTHEHQDHIMGVGVLARRYGIPIYASRGTIDYLRVNDFLKKIPDENIRIIEKPQICINNIIVNSFNISHDANEPCGYVVWDANSPDNKIAIATDTGIITESIKEAVLGANTVLLESNHDVARLEFGDYPYELKVRIKSRIGHLSNDDAAKFAIELAGKGAKTILLGHLSEKNNIPELAYETVNAAFKINKVSGVDLSVAPRYSHSKIYEV